MELVCQEKSAPQSMECVADHCVRDVGAGFLFDKSAHLFVDLLGMKAIHIGIQA
jgi:hypothetical protein